MHYIKEVRYMYEILKTLDKIRMSELMLIKLFK